jgi:HD-GYP domain-containing protein (c-di-GMP phosphodiesterase class II)
VCSISPRNRLVVPGPSAGSPLLPQEDVWEVLERFAREVAPCDRSSRQKRLALEAVRDTTEAEAVYWYPGSSGEPVEYVSPYPLPADWCCAFAERLLAETPGLDGRLLRSVVPAAGRGEPVQPHSAALVRVSKTKSVWLVALNLTPGRRFQVDDLKIMSLIRQMLINQRRRLDLVNRLSDTVSWLVQCMASSIDNHVPHSRGHSERVAKIAVQIGKRLSLPTTVLSDLYFAGLLHDIGITGIPQSVLLKPAKLTDEEYAQVKTYPVLGDRMLADIKQLAHLRPAVRHHHERFDGQGYPDGLAGDGIPLMARILSVADAFDAMTSPRPHRPPLPTMRIDAILAEGTGRQWDPDVMRHFLGCRPHFQAVREMAPQAQPAPAVKQAVDAWNVGSSRLAAVGGTDAPTTPAVAALEETPRDSS